jgi:dGTP triphosphohydrolase
MPYSVDSDENKLNPKTPSEYMTMNDQLLYKLAALDASMNAGFRRLDEKMDRFQTDLHNSQIMMTDRLSELDKEVTANLVIKQGMIEANRDRIINLETSNKVLMARFAVAMAAILVVWTVFGPILRHAIGL